MRLARRGELERVEVGQVVADLAIGVDQPGDGRLGLGRRRGRPSAPGRPVAGSAELVSLEEEPPGLVDRGGVVPPALGSSPRSGRGSTGSRPSSDSWVTGPRGPGRSATRPLSLGPRLRPESLGRGRGVRRDALDPIIIPEERPVPTPFPSLFSKVYDRGSETEGVGRRPPAVSPVIGKSETIRPIVTPEFFYDHPRRPFDRRRRIRPVRPATPPGGPRRSPVGIRGGASRTRRATSLHDTTAAASADAGSEKSTPGRARRGSSRGPSPTA